MKRQLSCFIKLYLHIDRILDYYDTSAARSEHKIKNNIEDLHIGKRLTNEH